MEYSFIFLEITVIIFINVIVEFLNCSLLINLNLTLTKQICNICVAHFGISIDLIA